VQEIADAVLYEGYMLYPYRLSSVKNQQRWNFGVLYPRAYCEVQMGSESSVLQTECLFRTATSTRLTVKLRFLQIVRRTIGRFKCPPNVDLAGPEQELEYIDHLELDDQVYRPWQEVIERSYTYDSHEPASLSASQTMNFSFPAGDSREVLRDAQGRVAGAIVREWQTLAVSLRVQAHACRDDVVKLGILVDNCSEFQGTSPEDGRSRVAALLGSLVSAHLILGVENGEFLSQLDPPAAYQDLIAQCENNGAWPVLAGDDATTMLASPIILYDFPKIAPESAGNLFDATEIDEILSLRILTLTDQEKTEIRQSDDRVRQLLERTESIPEEQFMKLHGVLRGLTWVKEVLE
jgi:hydrogenase maturation protease